MSFTSSLQGGGHDVRKRAASTSQVLRGPEPNPEASFITWNLA